MTNFLIGKDDEYWISEVVFRRKEIRVMVMNTKQYVVDIFYLKWGEENKPTCVACS